MGGVLESDKLVKDGAFSKCMSLKVITFAEGSQLKDIGKYTF